MTAESIESTITAWLATQQEAMLRVLEQMVNTDGGSYDKAGVDAVGGIVRRFMAENGIPTEVVPREKYGDCIKARVEGHMWLEELIDIVERAGRQAQHADHANDRGAPLDAVQIPADRFRLSHRTAPCRRWRSSGGTSSSVAFWLSCSART